MSVRLTSVVCLAAQAIGLIILMMTRNMGMVWVFVVVFGFSLGAASGTQAAAYIYDYFPGIIYIK